MRPSSSRSFPENWIKTRRNDLDILTIHICIISIHSYFPYYIMMYSERLKNVHSRKRSYSSLKIIGLHKDVKYSVIRDNRCYFLRCWLECGKCCKVYVIDNQYLKFEKASLNSFYILSTSEYLMICIFLSSSSKLKTSMEPTLYLMFWGILQSMRILCIGSLPFLFFLKSPCVMFYSAITLLPRVPFITGIRFNISM